MMKTISIILALFMGAFSAKGATAKLASKIVELRSEVEILNTEYLANKAELSNELKAKGARISQLETQLGQEEVRKKQATEKIAAIKEQLEAMGNRGSELNPLIDKTLIRITKYINKGLPFKKEKRLKDVEDIKEKFAAKVITPESALGRTWALLEDEMRITRENDLHRQTINLNGEERLATIAKIGMVHMYFHTIDNKVGHVAKNEQNKYIFVEDKNKKRKDLIFTLVDGLRKQIRHGKYDLPVAIN